MSLAGLVIAVGLVLRVFLVDAVVGQVHELVTQSLHGRRIPAEEKHTVLLADLEIGLHQSNFKDDVLFHLKHGHTTRRESNWFRHQF